MQEKAGRGGKTVRVRGTHSSKSATSGAALQVKIKLTVTVKIKVKGNGQECPVPHGQSLDDPSNGKKGRVQV